MLMNDGYSFDNGGKNYKKRGSRYSTGEIVRVEFNPTTGTVTYTNSKKDVLYKQETGIKSSEKSLINFCVLMDNPNQEVSIVPDR